MKFITFILLHLVMLSSSSIAKIVNSEITTSWEERIETLIPETSLPPTTGVNFSNYLGRIRLQDARSFPVLEMRYSLKHRYTGIDTTDFRLAGLFGLPLKGFTFKGIFVEQDSDQDVPEKSWSAYGMYNIKNFNAAIGLDYKDMPVGNAKLYSARAKYKIEQFTIMGGISSNPDDIERYSVGGLVELPEQLMVGGLLGVWDDDKGFAFNLGRYNKRGDFDRLPSFSLNYLEVPKTYKWTNFRIMFGGKGAHYVRPTFDNRVFSGQLDLDVALMLAQLIPDNYRHFDSPLLFLRYDEYGTMALRVNFIETKTNFRKLDINVNYLLPFVYGALQNNRITVSFERMHNPVFKWQDNRYHLNLASHLFGKVYSGVTISDDFENYSNVIFEFRIKSEL